MSDSIFKWTDEQKAQFRQKMIEKYGSQEAWNKSQADRRKGKKKRVAK